MDRRIFIAAVGALFIGRSRVAHGQSHAFTDLLSQLQNDPGLVEASWSYREPSVSRGVGRGTPSRRKLSQRASDLIIACEIASPAAYERKYQRPIWPKGKSGVTIGVGYDLRFANRSFIDRDWPMLSSADRALLASVITLSGQAAAQALTKVQTVVVPWNAAKAQFFAFLPFPTRQTEDAFPNCGKLPDDSFGALVSLVYNRGSSIARNSQSRREMYEIQQLMLAEQFGRVPDRIRAMKRLWQSPNARGLVIRREAEAVLFEQGMASA